MNGLLATLLAASSADYNPKYSLAFEVGILEHNDVDWERVDSWQTSSVGFRAGYNLSPRLNILASYQGYSSSDYSNGYNYDYEENYTSASLESSSIGVSENLITIGPRLNFGSMRWLVPYATAQAVVVIDQLTMGDSLTEEYATTFMQDTAMGFGALGALGIEFRTRPIASKFQPQMYFEYGGGATTALNFFVPGIGVGGDDLPIGDLQYGGSHFRFGIGTQF